MKYAICSGINKYPDRNNWLKGCVNDATGWYDRLKAKFGYSGILITDREVTAPKILIEFKKASSVLKSGDSFVFTYSGHGSSVPDKHGDEADGRDECICLWDRFFIDDELRRLFDAFAPGVNMTFISDSCHSGTVTREFKPKEIKYRVPRYMIPKDAEFAANVLDLPIIGKIIGDRPESIMKEVLVTGCTNVQYSYDAYFAGKNYGAMSYNCFQVIDKATGPMSYAQFYSELSKLLPSASYPQNPQLEGTEVNKNRVLFS